jgi:mono/diheme cytochrome c family protein
MGRPFRHCEQLMKNIRTAAAAILFPGLLACAAANAADSAAGQKTFTATCAACHQLKSYAGKSEADLVTKIQGIVAGTVKHPKKLTLNADDIANIAAYISSNEPK